MKKILSLLLVAVMVFGVIGLVGCKGEKETTTTTEAPVTTTPATTTSSASTTTTTTTASETTTTTAKATTTTTTKTTTTTSTTTTTTGPTTTTAMLSTTLPMFARFDFGTDTTAQDSGDTSHEWLVNNLTYNEEYLKVEFLEDSWKIYALKSYIKGETPANAYALCFENINVLDFDVDLTSGWGTWTRYPSQTGYIGKSWEGKHQYMKIRIKNTTKNNMISFQFKCNGGFSTTTNVSNMYLQDGIDKITAEKESNEWKVYYYDVPMCCQASSHAYGAGRDADKCKSYSEWLKRNAQTGGSNGLNWTQNATGLRFNLLGAEYYIGSRANTVGLWCDSRVNIKRGNSIEVDYIVFGSTVDQLSTFQSKMELAATK